MNKILTAAQAAANKTGNAAQRHVTTEGHKESLTATQLAAIEAGNFNASTEKKKKAIQKLLLNNPGHITDAVSTAIDNGEELELLSIPLEKWEDALPENRKAIRQITINGMKRLVLCFVAPKAESGCFKRGENRTYQVERDKANANATEIPYINDDDEELKIIYKGHDHDDPTGTEGTFNADKARFLSQIPEDLAKIYQTWEDEKEQWEIAEEFGIKQSTVSKHLNKVMAMWRRYYRA